MSEIRVNGVGLYYEEHGSGDPILCIHGTGSSTALWREPATRLAAHGRTIVYDRRGFGASERPDPFVTSVREQADDAAALLDALDAAPAVVIGRSHGGEIAVDLALRYSDRVRALALLEGGAMSLAPAFQPWVTRLHERLFAAAEADVGTVGETMLRGVRRDDAGGHRPGPRRGGSTANGPAIVAEERGGRLDVRLDELGTIAQPTLIVGARSSGPEFAEVTALLARAIPSARLAWVEGGHLIDPAGPDVRDFVDEVLATSAAREASRA